MPWTTSAMTSGACPTFLRAACREAAQGGASGYEAAGYNLAGHLPQLGPDDATLDEWCGLIEADLVPAIMRRDDAAVIAWFVAHLPRCIDLVTARRRPGFFAGICRAVIEDEVEIARE